MAVSASILMLWIICVSRNVVGEDTSSIPLPPDQLQEPELVSLLGLKLALEKKQHEFPQFMLSPRTTTVPMERSNLRADTTFEPNVRISAQTSGNPWSVVCEVESMQLNHNVHLVCPLMQPRCFENCKRICEPTGCVMEPSLAGVLCTARQTEPTSTGGFVRRFEYQLDRYDQNITGSWSCYFAGTESDKIQLVAEKPTTTTVSTTVPTTTTTTTTTTVITTSTPPTTPRVILPTDMMPAGYKGQPQITNTWTNVNQSEERGKPITENVLGFTQRNNNSLISSHDSHLHPASRKTNQNISEWTHELQIDKQSNGRLYPFLTFISSNIHVVLGFMALLALSLLTNLVFCLQFLRITRKRAKSELMQSPYPPSSPAALGLNNSNAGTFKLVRTREPSYATCRPVSWISPIANNSATLEQHKSPGRSVTNSKSCHFASLSVQLGGENTLVNPVTSQQYISAAPLRYWTASPMTTSMYPGGNDVSDTLKEVVPQIEPSNNLWSNQTSAMKSSCSFSSNGLCADDTAGLMHRSVTLPFSNEPEGSYVPLPIYMPTSASRTPSQTSVGVRLLPSYGLPHWFTPPQRCASKVRLLPKSGKEIKDDSRMKRATMDNGIIGTHNRTALVIDRQSGVRKMQQPLCNVLQNPTSNQTVRCSDSSTTTTAEATEMSQLMFQGYPPVKLDDQNRFLHCDNRKLANFHCVPQVSHVSGV